MLERNPTYCRQGQPLLDRLEFHLVDSRQQARASAPREGKVDFVSYLHAEHVAGARAWSGSRSSPAPRPPRRSSGFNLREPPYNDVRVRKAIRAGLDIHGLVERFHPGARMASTLDAARAAAGRRNSPCSPARTSTQAERLLREAGVRKLPLTIYFPTGRDTSAEDAVLFRPLHRGGPAGAAPRGAAAAGVHRRGCARAHPRLPRRCGSPTTRTRTTSSTSSSTRSAQTIYPLGYQNAELDRLTAEARVSIDPDLRNQLYRRAEQLFVQDCPLIPLYHDRIYAVASPLVQALRLHQTPPQVRFEELWVDTDSIP